MNFYTKINKFLDVQDYYHDVFAVNARANSVGLLKASENLLGKPICKFE